MSGLVIADARYATGSAARVVRRYLAQGGVYGTAKSVVDLRTVVPIDRVAAADVVLVRVTDREWVVTKDKSGAAGMVLGPDEVSVLLGERRAQEYKREQARAFLDAAAERGEFTPNGGDVTMSIDGDTVTFHAIGVAK